MQASETIELAALLASRSDLLLLGIEDLSERSLHDYWTASKCRQDRWVHALKGLEDGSQQGVPSNKLVSVIEELLVSELLTRVWAATLTAHDRLRGTNRCESIGRSILIGHMEVRNRALNIMLRGTGIDVEQTVALNDLRRKVERWTDLLLAFLAHNGSVSEMAFDASRFQDHADDLRHSRRQGKWDLVVQVLMASLKSAFAEKLAPDSPNADLNQKVSEAILLSLPPDLFDSTGLFKSLWLLRMHHVANETEGMIRQYLSHDDESHRDSAIHGATPRF